VGKLVSFSACRYRRSTLLPVLDARFHPFEGTFFGSAGTVRRDHGRIDLCRVVTEKFVL